MDTEKNFTIDDKQYGIAMKVPMTDQSTRSMMNPIDDGNAINSPATSLRKKCSNISIYAPLAEELGLGLSGSVNN